MSNEPLRIEITATVHEPEATERKSRDSFQPGPLPVCMDPSLPQAAGWRPDDEAGNIYVYYILLWQFSIKEINFQNTTLTDAKKDGHAETDDASCTLCSLRIGVFSALFALVIGGVRR